MNAILHGLGRQPFVQLFLVVDAGYAPGRMKVKEIGLGATPSTLRPQPPVADERGAIDGGCSGT